MSMGLGRCCRVDVELIESIVVHEEVLQKGAGMRLWVGTGVCISIQSCFPCLAVSR